MANDAKRISDLNTANTLALTDRVVVVYNATTTANVMTITVNNFMKAISNNVSGPYASDSAANTAGIPVKGLYYDNSGFLKIRLT